MDFSLAEVEIHLFQGMNAREAFVNFVHEQDLKVLKTPPREP
jgi:hypothetical protein